MRIIMLTQYYPPEMGAPQVRLSAIARQLARDHEVEVITAMPSYPVGRTFDGYRRKLTTSETIDGIPVRRVWAYASMGRGVRRLVNYCSFTATSLLALLPARRADWIFVESPPLMISIPAIVWAKVRRVRVALNVADLWPDVAIDVGALPPDGMLTRFARRVEQFAYRHSDLISCATEGLQRTVRARTRPDVPVVLLPNGVDVTLFRPEGGRTDLRDALGLQAEGQFLYTGNLGHVHGVDRVIDAMAIVAKVEPEIDLALIGHGSMRHDLEQQARRLDLSNVRFIDPLPLADIAGLLPLACGAIVSLAPIPANLNVRPSKMFPAMAAGCPIVYVGHSEGSVLLEHAAAGLVVPAESPDEIATAMIRLYRDRELGRELGGNGRRYVERELSWSAIVQRWIEDLHGSPDAQDSAAAVGADT